MPAQRLQGREWVARVLRVDDARPSAVGFSVCRALDGRFRLGDGEPEVLEPVDESDELGGGLRE